MYLFPDDMSIYVENSKVSIEKNLEVISNYGNVAEYKVKIQKSTTFSYSRNEQLEFKILNIEPFKLAPH